MDVSIVRVACESVGGLRVRVVLYIYVDADVMRGNVKLHFGSVAIFLNGPQKLCLNI